MRFFQLSYVYIFGQISKQYLPISIIIIKKFPNHVNKKTYTQKQHIENIISQPG